MCWLFWPKLLAIPALSGLPLLHALRSAASAADTECGAFLAHPPEYDRARAAVAYGDIARRVVLKLKYSGRPGVAETLAHFMYRHLGGDAETLLAPVPLHRWRIWKRGYNQSALIAGPLAQRRGPPAALGPPEPATTT